MMCHRSTNVPVRRISLFYAVSCIRALSDMGRCSSFVLIGRRGSCLSLSSRKGRRVAIKPTYLILFTIRGQVSRRLCAGSYRPSSVICVTGAPHCSDQDYMLALALQQEDASALASASGPTARAPSTSQTAPTGDEAVALALHRQERALLEQRIGGDRATATLPAASQGEPLADGAVRGVPTDRRGFQDRDR